MYYTYVTLETTHGGLNLEGLTENAGSIEDSSTVYKQIFTFTILKT